MHYKMWTKEKRLIYRRYLQIPLTLLTPTGIWEINSLCLLIPVQTYWNFNSCQWKFFTVISKYIRAAKAKSIASLDIVFWVVPDGISIKSKQLPNLIGNILLKESNKCFISLTLIFHNIWEKHIAYVR